MLFYYLCRCRNLQFGFLWSFDDDHRLLLESFEPADVLMGHVGQCAGGQLKKTSFYSLNSYYRVVLDLTVSFHANDESDILIFIECQE